MDFEQYIERLENSNKSHSSENYENINPMQIIDLQKELKEIVVPNWNNKKKFLKVNKKEKGECTVKLPKNDIILLKGYKPNFNEQTTFKNREIQLFEE